MAFQELINERIEGKKQVWYLTVQYGFKTDGKQNRKRKRVTITDPLLLGTSERAHIRLHDYLHKIEEELLRKLQTGNTIQAEKMTLKDFSELWIKEHAEKQLKSGSVSNYKSALKVHILPKLGHVLLSKIKPFDIVQFLSNLEKVKKKKGKELVYEKLSPAYEKIVYDCLANMFNRAEEWEFIERSPMTNRTVKRPKVPKAKIEFWTDEDKNKAVAAIRAGGESEKWRVLVNLALATGMRRGEICGLEWDNVHIEDMDNSYIDVVQQIRNVKGGSVISTTKTEENRRISLPPSIARMLKEYRKHWKRERLAALDVWQEHTYEWVFYSEYFVGNKNLLGKNLSPDSVTTKFDTIIKKYDLKKIHFHGMRHTHATDCIKAGMPLKQLSVRLGHKDVATTAEIYAHALESVDREYAHSMNHLYELM
jgi:integrase